MELMEAIRARKSYRNEFYNTPVPRSDLREILEAGLAAPSGCNLQTTQLIGVDDPVLVKRLAEIYGREWAATAPAAILVLTKETMSSSGVSYHVHDYSAAVENMLLAIAAKGYASVWIEGQIRGERAKEMGGTSWRSRGIHSGGISSGGCSSEIHGRGGQKALFGAGVAERLSKGIGLRRPKGGRFDA